MTGQHVTCDEAARFSLAADDSDARSRHDLAALDLIDRAKANGATWNTIGAALGMTGALRLTAGPGRTCCDACADIADYGNRAYRRWLAS